MQIEIVEMEDTRAKFILKNSSPAMANALRRTMLQDIPKMAIDKVDFHLGPIMQDDKEYESVTSLFDEIIAHRLGLVPVPTTDQFTFQKDCSCGGVGCPGCSIMYSLNKVGPGTVLSGDLQAVLIYATAVMGTAKQHVKWQAAFGVGYSYMPAIEIDAAKAADSDVRDYAVKSYPGLFKVEDGKLVVDDIYRASRYGKAIQQDPVLQDAVSIDWDDSNFIFKFETDGSLTAQQVLDKAVEILEATASEFTAAVEAL